MMNNFKAKGRVTLGLISSFILVFVSLNIIAKPAEDWAAPIANAQKLLEQKSYQESLKAFIKQADKGNGLAQFNLALFYDLGWGVTPDRVKACQWYLKAAQSNIPTAMQTLGQCFLTGEGVEQNKQIAFDWFIKAYKEGIADSGCLAAELLLKEDAKSIADINGESLCISAAQQGSIWAQSQLAHWYYEGKFLPQDYQKAFDWLRVVASVKSPKSAYLLAQYYDQGIGMDVDEKQALYWYEVAASGKYTKAYLPTSLLYWKAFNKSSADKERILAKSYLWAKTLSLSNNSSAEIDIANKLLSKVMQELPQVWLKNLDKKVINHMDVSALN